jgi:acylphosphatase
MSENTRNSRLAIVSKSTEGTLTAPSAGTQFIPLQPGFTFVPNVETIQNEEIRGSIGVAKSIQGIESPQSSVSEYLKHSGVEGTAPNWGALLASLMGQENLFYDPFVVSALNDKLNFTDDDGTVTATVAVGTYTTPQALATAVTAAMNAANGAKVATCVYNELTGKFKITSTGTVLSLLWKTGANGSDNTDTHIGTLLGYDDSANDTGTAAGTGYIADLATSGIESVLTAGSTVSNLVANAAPGSIAKGSAVLVKDGTNGYSIRAIDTVSSVNLTPSFNLENAPATGVKLGQCVNYTPLNSGHPVLDLWMYRGNGGDIEAIKDSRVVEMTMTVDVGQIINMAFSLEGNQFLMNPIEVVTGNKYLDFTDQDGTVAAAVPTGWYRSPVELAAAVQAAMRAVSARLPVVTYNSTGSSAGKFTISCGGSTLSLLWKTGGHGSDNTDDHIGTLLGFADTANKTGSLTYDSTSVQSWASSYTPSFDNNDPMVAKDMEFLVGDTASYESACIQSASIKVTNTKKNVRCINAESGVDGSVINKRDVEITVVAQLQRHDVDKFDRFINNSTIKAQFNFGVKSGGNWVAGKCGCVYAPNASVSSYQHGDDDGLVTMEYTIKPFVDASGNPEVYVNFL